MFSFRFRRISIVAYLCLFGIGASGYSAPPEIPGNAAYNLGNAYADYAGALLQNIEILWLLPTNLSDLQKAIETATEKLQPGETKDFNVYMTMSDGTTFVRFVGLSPTNEPLIETDTQRSVGQIQLSKSDVAFTRALIPFSEIDFNKQLKPLSAKLQYSDHVFAIGVLNTQVKPGLANLRDRTVVSGASGDVILVADQQEPKYRVLENGKSAAYPRGAALKEGGNSVWILSANDRGEMYTLMYSHFVDHSTLNPGDKVNAGDVLGKRQKPTKSSLLEIWRVDGPAQYFGKNGAYRIFPINGVKPES